MKYDESVCKFNMDTGCVELLLRDGRKISIDCTGVEDVLDVTMAHRSELDYLIYNDPLGYADLILNGNPKEYLKYVQQGVPRSRVLIKQYLQKLPQWGRFGVTSVTSFLLLPIHPEGCTPAHHT
mgnify:CR=1 FL=1